MSDDPLRVEPAGDGPRPERPGGAHSRISEHALAPVGAAFVATALWSTGNLIAVSVGLPGPQLAFWRTLFGAVLYGAIHRLRGGRYSREAFRAAALGGISFGLSAVLFFSALEEHLGGIGDGHRGPSARAPVALLHQTHG